MVRPPMAPYKCASTTVFEDPANGSAHTHKFAITKGDNTGGGSGDPPGGGW